MVQVATGTNELLCHIDDRVAVITLNKPQKKNALGDILTPALRQTLLTLEEDDRVGCVMITGAGDAFCAGGDVSEMGSRSSAPVSRQKQIEELTNKQETLTGRIYQLKKVTIAALPGAAAGAGMCIALSCDLRIASDNAFLTTAFRNIGLSGDYGGSWFLSRIVGLARAKELYFTAERISAEDALVMGLVNKVFPRETFRDDAMAYARHIAAGPTETLGRMKMNLNRGIEQELSASFRLEAEQLITSAGSVEAAEAIRAFMEKRTPRFHDE